MVKICTWPKALFREEVDLLAGFAFKSKAFTDDTKDIHLVKGADVQQGFISWDNCRRWPHPASVRLERYWLQENDVVLAMDRPWVPSGLKWAWIRRAAPKSLLVQRVARLRGRSGLATEYLRYLIGSPSFTDYIRPIVTGVNVPHISGEQILGFSFLKPTLPTQRKIAGILSAYDHLIENNLRRIKILEEMAQNLYREWFVKFRFPGHQNTRFVDSLLGKIPEGWEVTTLGEACCLNYGKALKKEDRRDGGIPVFGSSGVVGKHNLSLVKGPGIIVGRKGNVGSVFWCDKDFFVIDTAYYVTSKLPLRFLFYLFPTLNFINSDAAVPGLSRNQAYTLELCIPNTNLLATFCELADMFERQASNLHLQNSVLRQTRDLLLPKLISGEVDVSELDITLPEEAAT